MNENEKNFSFTDNNDGTVTKTHGDEEYVYNILVGKNIPDSDSIIDYCYFQKEETLVDELREAHVGESAFCSGTCVAMALAIAYGDSSITPVNVLYWGDDSDETNREVNWYWETDDNGNYILDVNGNRIDGGLRAWEQDNFSSDNKQMYDNRYQGEHGNYGAIDGSDIENDSQYLKNLKLFLSGGVPVIIDVGGHFVVVVGVESGIELENATINQLVIFDPGTNQDKKIAALGETTYTINSNRMITPYPYDLENECFYKDEHDEKTHDPYYIDPITKTDGSIVPAENGRIIKKIIASITGTSLPDSEKERIAAQMVKVFTGESDFVFENKTILENGEYTPGDNIRWDRVTVNVPDRYNEGYNKGCEDTKKAQDIGKNECGPDETPDPQGGGKYQFSEGAVMGLTSDNIGKIALQLSAKGTVYITDTVHGRLVKCGTLYREDTKDWLMILDQYNARTGELISSASGSWANYNGIGNDGLRISQIYFFKDNYNYIGISVNWHKYNAPYGYAVDTNKTTSWVYNGTEPDLIVSGTAPNYIANS